MFSQLLFKSLQLTKSRSFIYIGLLSIITCNSILLGAFSSSFYILPTIFISFFIIMFMLSSELISSSEYIIEVFSSLGARKKLLISYFCIIFLIIGIIGIILGIMFSIGFYYVVGLLAPVLLSSIDLFNSIIMLYTVFVIILAMGIGTIFGVIRTFNNVTK